MLGSIISPKYIFKYLYNRTDSPQMSTWCSQIPNKLFNFMYTSIILLPKEVTKLSFTFIKYVVKYKLKNSIQYLDGLQSSLNESLVFWNAGEGLTEDPVINTCKIIDDLPSPIPLLREIGFDLKFGMFLIREVSSSKNYIMIIHLFQSGESRLDESN
jgi:hypothetical protein